VRPELDGVAAADLAGRWGVPQCGLFRQLDSTFNAIHDLAVHGAPAGTVVIAEEQTAGRDATDAPGTPGGRGMAWHACYGPARAELGVMSVRVGLAVADAVDALLGRLETRLKWPNDVLLGERKLAGIPLRGSLARSTPCTGWRWVWV